MKHLIYCLLSLLFLAAPLRSSPDENPDSLVALLSETSGADKLALLTRLTEHHIPTLPQKALLYCEEALALTYELKDLPARAKVLALCADCHSRLGNSQKLLSIYQEMHELGQALKDPEIISDALAGIGGAYLDLYKPEVALKYLFEALDMKLEIEDEIGQGNILNAIGLIYLDMGSYEQAKDCLTRSLEIRKRLKDKKGVRITYNNLGSLAETQGNPEKALEYYGKSLKLAKEMGDRYSKVVLFTNIGYVHEAAEEYNKAKQYYQKARQICQITDNKYWHSVTLYHLGEIAFQQTQNDSAAYFWKEALLLAEENNESSILMSCYDGFYRLHAKEKRFSTALSYLEKHLTVRDSMYNFEKLAKIASIDKNYIASQKEKEIKILKDLQAAELKNEIANRNLFLALAGFLVITAILLIRQNRFKTKTNQNLKTVNNTLTERNAQLKQAMDEVKHLSGLLPICASCKKIRDDKGYWEEIEQYITEHSDAGFTHSICPSCFDHLYPQYSQEKK